MSVTLIRLNITFTLQHFLYHFLNVPRSPFLLHLAPLLHDNVFKPDTHLVLA